MGKNPVKDPDNLIFKVRYTSIKYFILHKCIK